MRSLYYLSHGAGLTRFDELFEREEVLCTPFDTAHIPFLPTWVKRASAIAQQDYIVIDVGGMTQWSMGGVLSAVQYLKSFSKIRIIFIGTPCDAVAELFRALIDVQHIDDVIPDEPGTDMEQALANCLAPPTRKLELVKSILQEEPDYAPAIQLEVPRGRKIHIAVAGTMARCGTTTQAFALWHYANSLGLHPALRDRVADVDPDRAILPILQKYDSCSQGEDGTVDVHGVKFTTKELPGIDCYVDDYGILTQSIVAMWAKADISILVGCAKPWELEAFGAAIQTLFGYRLEYMVALVSFATDGEVDDLAMYLGDHHGAVPYHPDLWSMPKDATVYDRLVLPALRSICRDKPLEAELEAGA